LRVIASAGLDVLIERDLAGVGALFERGGKLRELEDPLKRGIRCGGCADSYEGDHEQRAGETAPQDGVHRFSCAASLDVTSFIQAKARVQAQSTVKNRMARNFDVMRLCGISGDLGKHAAQITQAATNV
jgi:hypothetical protein